MHKIQLAFFIFLMSLAALKGEAHSYKLLIIGDIHYTNRSYHPQDHPRKQKTINKHIAPNTIDSQRPWIDALLFGYSEDVPSPDIMTIHDGYHH